MEALFAPRLTLPPLACAAVRLLTRDPAIGLCLGGPEPLRAVFLAELETGLGCRLDRRGAAALRTDAPRLLPTAGPVAADLAPSRPRLTVVAGADRLAPDIAAEAARLADSVPGLIAVDEAATPEDGPAAILSDRLGIWLDLAKSPSEAAVVERLLAEWDEADRARRTARRRVPEVQQQGASDDGIDAAIDAICETSMRFAITSMRAPLAALRLARLSAELAGRAGIAADDIVLAAMLALGPRARRLPQADAETSDREDTPDGEHGADAPADQPANDDRPTASPPPQPPRDDRNGEDGEPDEEPASDDLSGSEDAERRVETEAVAVPDDLLRRLVATGRQRPMAAGARPGRTGAAKTQGTGRGRPAGTRRGDPRSGAFDAAATLSAALPWQSVRHRRYERLAGRRIILLPDDVRLKRIKAKRETATIFCVDASGSAALARLAGAKGAVERILAECYRRRDRVALIAFRGTGAETLLPETRSLTRARRALAHLTAGGGTPLAAGIARAREAAERAAGFGRTPLLVFLTDGKANIGLEGIAGRAAALADAEEQARLCRATGLAALVVDLSLRPGQAAANLAEWLGARYLPLPNGEAEAVATAVAAEPSKATR